MHQGSEASGDGHGAGRSAEGQRARLRGRWAWAVGVVLWGLVACQRPATEPVAPRGEPASPTSGAVKEDLWAALVAESDGVRPCIGR